MPDNPLADFALTGVGPVGTGMHAYRVDVLVADPDPGERAHRLAVRYVQASTDRNAAEIGRHVFAELHLRLLAELGDRYDPREPIHAEIYRQDVTGDVARWVCEVDRNAGTGQTYATFYPDDPDIPVGPFHIPQPQTDARTEPESGS